MQKKVIGISIAILGIIIGTVTVIRSTYYSPQEETPVAQTAQSVSFSVSHPIQIIIPKINVNAVVEEVGITFKGNMSTPKKFADTGWYKYGTVPGELGSAVIDGHVDNGLGIPAVFINLKKLVPGDIVYVQAKNGRKLKFKVFDIQNYYYKDVPLEILFNRNGDRYLNLITCDGNWIPAEKTDDHRIVVYTKLIES